MEITDLQINDWVYDKSFTPSNFPCRIYSIEGRYPRRDKDFNDKPLIDVWVGDGFLSSHIENIEPIPLTAEILVKNGINGGVWEDLYGHTLLIKNNRLTYLFDGHKRLDLPYNRSIYVHELQHALKLCGLNDLADNFRV